MFGKTTTSNTERNMAMIEIAFSEDSSESVMIQGIIARLARCSFLIKGWSTVMLSVIVLFVLRDAVMFAHVFLLLFIPAVFWMLDAYFLHQERLYRGLYDIVRKQKTTEFGMKIPMEVRARCSFIKAVGAYSLSRDAYLKVGRVLLAGDCDGA